MASCAWSCHEGGTKYCSTMDDCKHRDQMSRVPTHILNLIDAWRYWLAQDPKYENPLREKFYINQHFGLVVYNPDEVV